MNDANPSDAVLQVRNMLMGFVLTRTLQVAAELSVADALAKGPKDRSTLAREVGADATTLHRLIRACASYGVFEELPDGRYANTPTSECLRSDVPLSLRPMARMYSDLPVWQAWAGMEASVRSGKPSFKEVHGVTIFEFFAAHPESARRFDDAMTASSRLLNQAVVEAYDWKQFGSIVDVAGGAGASLAAILKANPHMQGVLFDLPHVIERGRAFLAEQGLAARCRTEVGSFFDAIPPGADCYFMKHIIHDWDDDDCVRILQSCRKAMPDHARLLVCEKVVPPGNGPSYSKTMDLIMLVMTDGGRERTEQEYRELFARADLKLRRVLPMPADNSILEVTK